MKKKEIEMQREKKTKTTHSTRAHRQNEKFIANLHNLSSADTPMYLGALCIRSKVDANIWKKKKILLLCAARLFVRPEMSQARLHSNSEQSGWRSEVLKRQPTISSAHNSHRYSRSSPFCHLQCLKSCECAFFSLLPPAHSSLADLFAYCFCSLNLN